MVVASSGSRCGMSAQSVTSWHQREVKSAATEGSVQEDCARACVNRTPEAARASIAGVAAGPAP